MKSKFTKYFKENKDVVISIRLTRTQKDFLDKNKISVTKLLTKVIEELMYGKRK